MDNNNKLKVYWFGYGGSSWMAEKLRHLIEVDLEMSLITIHEHPNANIPWKLDSVYKNLENADIIIVPSNFKRQPHKSNNRLTQAMALGKPIICEPMPAYKSIVNNMHNAIILEGDSLDEWRFVLNLLKNKPNLRKKLSEQALVTSKKFSRKAMAAKWVNTLAKLKIAKKESVDIVIPTKKNIPILKECIKSFKNSTLEEVVYIIDNDTDSSDVEDMVRDLGLPYEVKKI
jgi:glycosyltransferase involved in cell wall biosynthesis